MTMMPPFSPGPDDSLTARRGSAERFAFQIAGKHYTLQFWRITYLEGHDDRQLAALAASTAYEVSFRLEDYTLPDGSVIAGYNTMGVGNPFQVLGAVANAVVEWAQRRQPEFLYWRAAGPRRQRVYDKMIRCFAARGSEWHRLPLDPFTGLHCQPDTFWLGNTSHDPVVLTRSTFLAFLLGLDPMTELPAHRRPPSGTARADEDASLWHTLRERDSGIDTIGIVSASNEAGRELSEAENDRRDEALRRDLAGYGPSQVRGRFGNVDKPFLSVVNPFIVVNMVRKIVIALGAKYHQFHVIFGAREGRGEDLAVRFELVEADEGERVLAIRRIFFHAHRQRLYLAAGCPDNRGDFFMIPGFDEDAPCEEFLGI